MIFEKNKEIGKCYSVNLIILINYILIHLFHWAKEKKNSHKIIIRKKNFFLFYLLK